MNFQFYIENINMWETTINFAFFSLAILGVVYIGFSLWQGQVIKIDFRKLFAYVTIFSILGIVGEIFVNEGYRFLFGQPLWEYHLLPVHDGNTSYLFLFIWGVLGCYKYITDVVFKKYLWYKGLSSGLVMGLEAIFLELLFNGLHYLFFGSYIFYYLPANLGPLSHLSCLQVIPFYFLFGLAAVKIIEQQPFKSSKSPWLLYWMTIVAFIWLV